MQPSGDTQHDAYLLRIWRAGQEAEWRAFVENVHTGEKHGFRDLNALLTFLQQAYGNRNAAGDARRRETEP